MDEFIPNLYNLSREEYPDRTAVRKHRTPNINSPDAYRNYRDPSHFDFGFRRFGKELKERLERSHLRPCELVDICLRARKHRRAVIVLAGHPNLHVFPSLGHSRQPVTAIDQ
ncbi:hypothetical protein ABKN59_010707 [Abortiporus biennis]